MTSFDYINRRGERLPLLNNKYFDLINIEGQTSGVEGISSVVNSGVDGDLITSAQAQPRTIILDLRIKGGEDVEECKREILKVIKLKQYGSIIWTQNNRTVVIYGMIESIDMPRWNNTVLMQVTLHCEQPFWEDIENVIEEINDFINLHYFTDNPTDMLYFLEEGIPFGQYDTTRAKSFHNAGDVSVGMEIIINAIDTVTNPIIYDTEGNYFGLNVTMSAGDKIVITTHKGNKTVKQNGVSIYDKVKPNSKWLQLEAGDNQFRIDSDDEDINNVIFNLVYKQRYI